MVSAAATPSVSATGPEGRDRVLDEAAALFLARGYAETSLRGIAAAAGMKAGSVYYHFASKEALLEAILRRGLEVMVQAFDDAEATTQERDGRTRIAAHVRAHLAALFEHGPYTAAHVTTFRTAPPAVRDAIVPERDAYEAMWTHLLEDLAAKGEIEAETPIGLSRLILFGAMNSSLEWFDPERGSLDDFAETVTHQLWKGIEG